ncbi:permease [Actinobacillus equuli]|nr:permease [Actinobacillus equuli]
MVILWAPNNGQAIEVSIGYLLLPIVAVALGKIVFKEHFTLLKWLSLGFAVIGVVSNIWLTGSFRGRPLLPVLVIRCTLRYAAILILIRSSPFH